MHWPLVQHWYNTNQFLRDVAKPVLEADSHTKGKLRRHYPGGASAVAPRHSVLGKRRPGEIALH